MCFLTIVVVSSIYLPFARTIASASTLALMHWLFPDCCIGYINKSNNTIATTTPIIIYTFFGLFNVFSYFILSTLITLGGIVKGYITIKKKKCYLTSFTNGFTIWNLNGSISFFIISSISSSVIILFLITLHPLLFFTKFYFLFKEVSKG